MDVSTVLAIQTRGRDHSSYPRWVTSYRVKYSLDCATFTSLLDTNGINQVRSFQSLFYPQRIAESY